MSKKGKTSNTPELQSAHLGNKTIKDHSDIQRQYELQPITAPR